MDSFEGYNEFPETEISKEILIDEDIEQGCDFKIKSFYYKKKYKHCLNEIINSNSKMVDESNYIRGLCCLLLSPDIDSNIITALKSKIKREGYSSYIYAYNYLTAGNKYTGEADILNKFALVLIDSGDGECIKYIRTILESYGDFQYIEVAKKAYERGMYYLSEEIINLYCRDSRYEYETLIILINIYLNTGKFEECQKHISMARVINNNLELAKLDCLCRINECKKILAYFNDNGKLDALNEVLDYLDKSEKILLNKEQII